MLDDPRAARATISAKEVRWVRSIADRLAIDDPMFEETFDRTRLRTGRVAYRLLVD